MVLPSLWIDVLYPYFTRITVSGNAQSRNQPMFLAYGRWRLVVQFRQNYHTFTIWTTASHSPLLSDSTGAMEAYSGKARTVTLRSWSVAYRHRHATPQNVGQTVMFQFKKSLPLLYVHTVTENHYRNRPVFHTFFRKKEVQYMMNMLNCQF